MLHGMTLCVCMHTMDIDPSSIATVVALCTITVTCFCEWCCVLHSYIHRAIIIHVCMYVTVCSPQMVSFKSVVAGSLVPIIVNSRNPIPLIYMIVTSSGIASRGVHVGSYMHPVHSITPMHPLL